MTEARRQFPQITSEEHTTIPLIEESHLKDLVEASFAWLSLLEGYQHSSPAILHIQSY